jgi:hypothetical protein
LPVNASIRRVDLEVLIWTGIRNIRGGFSPGERPCPLVRFAPSGVSSASLGNLVTAPSARALTVGAACAPAADLQRIDRLTA